MSELRVIFYIQPAYNTLMKLSYAKRCGRMIGKLRKEVVMNPFSIIIAHIAVRIQLALNWLVKAL